ncbi:MAG: hypothetical protein ABSH05_27785, partial [Bryobacteraceae bacterium]
AGKTVREAEEIPLFFTLIPVLTLLSNYDQENCLINVGTEGASTREARSFWQPIMDIGPGARYWMVDFFRCWFVIGSRSAPSLSAFGEHWKEMIAYSLDSPQWTPGTDCKSYHLEECCSELMGLVLAIGIVSEERFTPVISSLKALFQRWAELWLDRPRAAAQFAYFLSKPAGRALLPDGVRWLSRAVQGYSQYDWRERDLDGTLAGALRACWRHSSDQVRRDVDLQAHFLQLLNALCRRLSGEALALRTQVAQDMPVQGT